jgi:hypothetical protein
MQACGWGGRGGRTSELHRNMIIFIVGGWGVGECTSKDGNLRFDKILCKEIFFSSQTEQSCTNRQKIQRFLVN